MSINFIGAQYTLSVFFLVTACSSFTPSVPGNEVFDQTHQASNLRDGDQHMAKGYAFLRRAEVVSSDFYFARSAFERAAIIRVDDPTPEYLKGYAFFELGQYRDATLAFVSAALLNHTSDAWWLASLAALRSGHEMAAQSLYEQGRRANSGTSATLSSFMESLYGSVPNANDVVVNGTFPAINSFTCNGISDEVEEVEGLCASDLELEFYIVERTLRSDSTSGQDLIGNLSLNVLGGRIINDSSSSNSTSSNSTSIASTITLDVPSINYDLSFASDGEVSNTVTATPRMRVRLNEDSIIASGLSRTVVLPGEDFSRGLEVTSGINLTVSLGSFTEIGGRIVASVEFSDPSELIATGSYVELQNNTSSMTVAGEAFYNEAFILGSLETTGHYSQAAGQTGLRDLPVVGAIFGQTNVKNRRKEFVVMGVLRQPASIAFYEEARVIAMLSENSIEISSGARRKPIVHTMPSLRSIITEMGLLK